MKEWPGRRSSLGVAGEGLRRKGEREGDRDDARHEARRRQSWEAGVFGLSGEGLSYGRKGLDESPTSGDGIWRSRLGIVSVGPRERRCSAELRIGLCPVSRIVNRIGGIRGPCWLDCLVCLVFTFCFSRALFFYLFLYGFYGFLGRLSVT